MPLVNYTGEELIVAVKNLAMNADSGSLGHTDDVVLSHINQEMSIRIIPALLDAREEYWAVTTRVTIPASGKIRIPSRAILGKIRYVCYVDADGDLDATDLPCASISTSHEFNWSTTGRPAAYYLEGTDIRLIGRSFTGSIDISWYFRPGQIVLSTECREITYVDTATKTVTLASSVPVTWGTSDTFDVHSALSGAEIKVWEATATAVGGSGTTNRVTFLDAIDGTGYGTKALEAGDWLCLTGEAALPALPVDMHPVLVRAGAARIAEARGDMEALKAYHELLEASKKQMVQSTKSRSGDGKLPTFGEKMLWKANNG
jgi:hypothetical protein